jgi:small redox-active disulfide protein 2
MEIKILGSGCKKCHQLEKNVRDTVEKLQISADIEHISDIERIIGYGVMSTPALVLDNKVISSGKVLKAKELESIFVRSEKNAM